MTPDEFRTQGHAMIEWIARYMETVEDHPVRSQVAPGDIRAALPERPPETGEPFEQIMADVDAIIMPGITHWQSPNFFAYFPCNASGPGILGELLSAGLGVQGMLWLTSPACTELETHVLDWCAHLLGLPDSFLSGGPGGGVIQDSASSATLCAMLAARERARRSGADDSQLMAYASTQSHSSVQKAARIMGLRDDQLTVIQARDASYAMDADALETAVAQDGEAGRHPFFVCATVGTTSSNAMDPLPAIGAIAGRHGMWMHVDAAMSGTAAACPEFRWIHDGLESADSYCFNPHKWMFTNFDCDCFYVADRSALIGALGILPEYLKTTTAHTVIDYRDWQVPLGRRFRSLKLWFVLRHYGVEGIRHHVREHVRLTQEFAAWVAADPDWEVLAPHPLNLVCFAHAGGNERTKAILESVNASGALYASHTVLDGRYAIRMSIGQTHTGREHVAAAWQAFSVAAASR